MKDKILKFLESNNMSALELSRISGVKRSTMYNILNDVIDPLSIGTSKAVALAHAMGMTVDELVGSSVDYDTDLFDDIRKRFGADVRDLVRDFLQLNSAGRDKLSADLEDMLQLEKYTKKIAVDAAI